ncbi:NAD(P)H:quinone oxidoreductase [Actinomycetospora sp. OC33-EN08]|uniref:NAD(P)H:quinone oxidoreductase n=1 Tax=Actinomycetospora aurantiaca TaxID=3129233 RepID=A0ABU8MNG8_9PSEU
MIDESTGGPRVAVVYYSSTGTVAGLARAVAEGVREAGGTVVLRRVAESAPDEAVASNEAWAAHRAADADVPVVEVADLLAADAVVLGTPTRFGNVSSQLKGFLDTLGGPWSRGELADKVYSVFVASDTAHGGQESTLLALYQTIHHFGGVLVAPGYTDAAKFADGNPYGTGHVTDNGPLGETSLEAARVQGRRVARFARAVAAVTPARAA